MTSSPSSIGSYRVVETLGAGGMAQLYAAEPERGGDRVALKVIHPHLASEPRFVEMFLDEARVMKRIDHPNVVRALELDKDGDEHFMVMEYVDGVTLGVLMDRACRRREKIAVDLAVSIAAKILAGLHAAHDCRGYDGRLLDVVHRDVSPQNILVGRDGAVKVIDFGIAKARGRLHQTKNGNIKGKLRYMAPEHCTGARVDRRSDLYALAVMLWEMLTLRPYFDGRNELDLVRQVRRPTYRSLAVWNQRVTSSLESVLRKALHPTADKRYQDAEQLRQALLEACPQAAAVTPERVASLVSTLTPSPEQRARIATSAGGGRRRGAASLALDVVMPPGAHAENVPETLILGDEVRRMAAPAVYEKRSRRRRRGLGWLAAAAMLSCFVGGAGGVAMGHALSNQAEVAPVVGASVAAPVTASVPTKRF